MPHLRTAGNTAATYGRVERAFHWSVALLIASAVGLGLAAQWAPLASDAAWAWKARLFSLHKTVGVAAFAVALARIAWAAAQPRPRPLHPERRWETRLARAVHGTLYGALVLVPLSGWLAHAAMPGFAPILLPVPQSLALPAPWPERLAALHVVAGRVLLAAVALHVAGALRHALERDGTLARMWNGWAPPEPPPPPRDRAPLLAAIAVWAVAVVAGLALAPTRAPVAAIAPAPASGWQVESGTLGIVVRQMGAEVEGTFDRWTAAIDYDPEARTGTVDVRVDVASLRVGAVSTEAAAPEFLDAAAHPTATFRATIRPEGAGLVADGTLALRGVVLPLALPFALHLDGDRATANGEATLDRLAFGIGASYPEDANVGHAVRLRFALVATREAP
ncbi:cytochrome b/b6 domain-containing protein [Jannaschia sp. W003]|uniref:cytochrome b/b6 domain-containing protein n=1 Tax=Jannaschia sp. W003 TaxID=2867012 RepID=UPI0021A619FD|nr:cytochrome b/b6 domain-containing protein [Jannaschia sp. W003]UWQ20673.1 cytochrome b/b6 domain-containing protein [Jannaschia sp. W003]